LGIIVVVCEDGDCRRVEACFWADTDHVLQSIGDSSLDEDIGLLSDI